MVLVVTRSAERSRSDFRGSRSTDCRHVPGRRNRADHPCSRHELPNGRSEFNYWGSRIPPQEGRAVLAIDGLGLPVMRSFMIGISSGQPTLPTFPGCERRSTEKCAVNEEYSHGAP